MEACKSPVDRRLLASRSSNDLRKARAGCPIYEVRGVARRARQVATQSSDRVKAVAMLRFGADTRLGWLAQNSLAFLPFLGHSEWALTLVP